MHLNLSKSNPIQQKLLHFILWKAKTFLERGFFRKFLQKGKFLPLLWCISIWIVTYGILHLMCIMVWER